MRFGGITTISEIKINFIEIRFDFEVKLLPKQEQICNYTLPDGRTFEIVLPAVENDPRIIFWSCNDKCNPYGISSVEAKDMCWKFLVNEHRSYKYHLMIGGNISISSILQFHKNFICFNFF
jgi:hypothetical protein